MLKRGFSGYDIESWLEMESETGCRIENYSDREIAVVMNLRFHSVRVRQLYAMWFMKQYQDEDVQETIITNMLKFHRCFEQGYNPDESGESPGYLTNLFLV